MLSTTLPKLRAGLPGMLAQFRRQARGHAEYEAVADIHEASERLFAGAPADEVVTQALAALTATLPPNAANLAALLGLITLRLSERYDIALPMLDLALARAREEGHSTRQGIIHSERARIALARGALHTRWSRPRPGWCWSSTRTSSSRSCSRWQSRSGSSGASSTPRPPMPRPATRAG